MNRCNNEDHELYSTWKSMKSRCNNPNVECYKYYGGRGISVCKEWEENFWKFVSDVGDRPLGCTLDRKNNDGDYSKENCKWSSLSEQANNKSDSVELTFEGETLTEKQLADKYGIPRTTLQARRNSGCVGDELIFGRVPKNIVEYQGFGYRQKDFAKILGISPQLLNKRIKERGSTAEELINEFGTIQTFESVTKRYRISKD